MGPISRFALACAGAALLAAPAIAAADATIRVEGSSATLVPQTAVALDPSPLVIDDSFDSDAFTLPGDRATAQLERTATAAGVPVGYQVFDFGSLVQRIGPDAAAAPPAFTPFWRLKVNDRTADVGADAITLQDGDVVTWAFVDDFEAPELELTLARGTARAGTTVAARVVSHDNAGVASPAAGAQVRYGASSATTGPDGTANLTAAGAGPAPVSASRAGAVRSEVRALCAFAEDPSVCGILTPPSATPVPVAAPTPSPQPAPAAAPGTLAGVAAPLCRAVPERPRTPGQPAAVRLAAAQLLVNQRIAQAAIRRANAIQAWLDEGLVEADLCGASLGPEDLGPGISVGAGPVVAPTEASPRPVPIPPAAAGAAGDTGAVGLSAAQLRVNQRIAQAAVRRVNALTARLEGGLTGGDIRDGQVSAAKLARGLAVTGTGPATPVAPSQTVIAPPTDGEPGTVPLSAEQLLVNQRVSQAALRRANLLLDRLEGGLGGADLRDGSIGPDDLSPTLRGAS